MPKRYTIKEVKNKLHKFGFKLVGKYINSHIKTQIQCHCGKIFNCRPNHIFTQSCKSCGRCNEPNIGDKFNSLTIIEIQHKSGRGCMVGCICNCGNKIKLICFHKIMTGHTKSCGHCNDPKVGNIFGKLTIIEVKPSPTNGCSIKCRCECGKIKWYRSNRITSGSVSSCGNCKLIRNGITTSKTALELHILTEKILNKKCEHNIKFGHYYIDIVQPDLKIAIEYDSYYYHRVFHNTINKEQKINKLLKQNKYKILRIRSGGYDIPTEKQLYKAFLDLQNGAHKRTITMKSWKKEEQKHRKILLNDD